MLVVLEGPDGVGKTVLSQKLKGIGSVMYAPLPRVDSYNNREDWQRFIEVFGKSDNIYILDRCFLSEFVYRLFDKDDTYMTFHDVANWLDVCAAVVICRSDTAYEDAMNRGEDNITDREKHTKITEMYEHVIHMIKRFTKVPVIDYCWKTMTDNEIKKLIKQMINNRWLTAD